jgi:CheY-like chemotaxis protein/two-component sensor histidine kinase
MHEERMHAMGVVASGLAHDLNHSLNVIALRIATLRADPRFDPAQRSLEGLGHVVDEAAATVARLQDLARRRRDRPAESVDLTAVLLGAVEMARTELDGRGAALHIEDDIPPLPMVRGTAAELSHLFGDLLANARDSTPKGGTVEVRARATRGSVVVTVADQGQGIPEESLSRVFDPFFSSRDTRETGLALSIAYGLMQRLGGSISAANRPTAGSVYTLTFPLASAQRQRGQQKACRPRKTSVLLVDDESDNLEVLEELLTLEGHRVETATSGKAAVERFQRGEHYDLVLCDVGMPQMSGWQVVREIRRLAPSARIWLLTGWANEISEHDPRLEDVQGVLGKPLDLDELRSLLGDPQGPTPSEHHAMA